MNSPKTDLSTLVDSQYNLISARCQYCEEAWPIGQTEVSNWFTALWHLSIDCPARQETSAPARSMRSDYEPAGRNPAHTFKDFRSARRARKRQRTEKEKYHNYQYVKRGQLGTECYEADFHSPLDALHVPRPEARLTTMTKTKLYREAQRTSDKPRHHRFCTWCQLPREKEKRNTDMRVIKRFELDPVVYDDTYETSCYTADRSFRCEICYGDGSGALYDENGMVGWTNFAEMDEQRRMEELMSSFDDSDQCEAEYVEDDFVVLGLDNDMNFGSDDGFLLVFEKDKRDVELADHAGLSDGEEGAYEESRSARP